jgi:hypothetical protein
VCDRFGVVEFVMRIRTHQQYEAALARFHDLFGSLPGSLEAAEMDKLARALDNYEDPRVADVRALERQALIYASIAVFSLVAGFILGNAAYRAIAL